MATVIEWTVTITTISVSDKTASIHATREVYDDADPTTILETETHSIITAVLDTGPQKTDVVNNLWQQHLDYQAKKAAIAVYIGGLEATAKANLEARE